jgi:hypothetical protein
LWIADVNVAVQRAAARSLMEQPLASEEQQRVSQLVSEGRTLRANDPLIVTLLQRRVEGVPQRAALEFVLARADDDPRLRGRIRNILRDL